MLDIEAKSAPDDHAARSSVGADMRVTREEKTIPESLDEPAEG
jgi:hypothetical protein